MHPCFFSKSAFGLATYEESAFFFKKSRSHRHNQIVGDKIRKKIEGIEGCESNDDGVI